MIEFHFPKAPKPKGPPKSEIEVGQMQAAIAPRLAEAADEAAEQEARRKSRSLLMEKGSTKTRFASLLGNAGGRSSLLGGS